MSVTIAAVSSRRAAPLRWKRRFKSLLQSSAGAKERLAGMESIWTAVLERFTGTLGATYRFNSLSHTPRWAKPDRAIIIQSDAEVWVILLVLLALLIGAAG